jgi:iron-sulfur cluster assembly accessory protein
MTDTSVQTAAHGVGLTDAAAGKVRSLLDQEGRDDLKLRLAVQPGGCSGLIYQLFFDERTLDGDASVEFGEGVEVVVDKMSVPYLDRFRRHHPEAGLHDRQPQRRGFVRVRRQLPLTQSSRPRRRAPSGAPFPFGARRGNRRRSTLVIDWTGISPCSARGHRCALTAVFDGPPFR